LIPSLNQAIGKPSLRGVEDFFKYLTIYLSFEELELPREKKLLLHEICCSKKNIEGKV
jgi:hypothetical protein